MYVVLSFLKCFMHYTRNAVCPWIVPLLVKSSPTTVGTVCRSCRWTQCAVRYRNGQVRLSVSRKRVDGRIERPACTSARPSQLASYRFKSERLYPPHLTKGPRVRRMIRNAGRYKQGTTAVQRFDEFDVPRVRPSPSPHLSKLNRCERVPRHELDGNLDEPSFQFFPPLEK